MILEEYFDYDISSLIFGYMTIDNNYELNNYECKYKHINNVIYKCKNLVYNNADFCKKHTDVKCDYCKIIINPIFYILRCKNYCKKHYEYMLWKDEKDILTKIYNKHLKLVDEGYTIIIYQEKSNGIYERYGNDEYEQEITNQIILSNGDKNICLGMGYKYSDELIFDYNKTIYEFKEPVEPEYIIGTTF